MLTRIVLIKPKHDLTKDEFNDYVKKFEEEFKALDMVFDYRDAQDTHPLNQGYTFTALIDLEDREHIPVYEQAIMERIKPLLGEMADHYIVTHV